LNRTPLAASFPAMPVSERRAAHPSEAPSDVPRGLLLVAFASIYLIWGSTYLAIRWAIEGVPPFLMAAVRFLVAGGGLYAWLRVRGQSRPTRRQWLGAAISGGLLIAGGNGSVVVAEQWVPSGLAALLIGSVPLWLVVLDTVAGSRVRPSRRVALGLVVGFGGVGVLAGSPGAGAGGPQELAGAMLILGGSVCWAAGSLYSRYAPSPPRPSMWVAMQMLSGGAVMTVLTLLTGEAFTFEPAAVSLRAWLALAYLIVFGALVAYSAYVWLLSVSTPARVGTYAYVNPVVALLLGWTLADEPLTFRTVVAAVIILGSVVIITSERPRTTLTRARAGSI
jgi:drug/metabolite transporter (DMT)-like permease